MSVTHQLSSAGRDDVPVDSEVAPKQPVEREPSWNESGFDPAFVEAAKKVSSTVATC